MNTDRMISLQLKSITDKLRQYGDSVFARYGLTGPQVGYLSYIRDAGGSIFQNDLEKAAGVSHPTIVGVITRLRDKGFVDIQTDEKDRRKRLIALTDKARDVTSELIRGENEMSVCLLQGVTPQEQQELLRLLNIMENNLSALLSGKEIEKDEKREQN